LTLPDAHVTRCGECRASDPANVKIVSGEGRVRDQPAEQLRDVCQRFARCADCGHVYWHGAHAAHLEAILATAQAAVGAMSS
jgi:hypothetical protein